MANKEKVELKTLLYQNEIKEYEKQLKNLDQQKHEWLGYGRAYSDANEVFKILFKDLKYGLDWLGFEEDEKEKMIQENPNCTPKVEVTEREGFKIAEFLKPAHHLISVRLQKAKGEPSLFEAQKNVINRQIDRLGKAIEYEQNKLLEEETGTDVLNDPWDEVNADESEMKEPTKEISDSSENSGNSESDSEDSKENSRVVKIFGKKKKKKKK